MAVAGHRTSLRAPRVATAAPWIVLGAGSLLVALAATLVAVRVNGLASLDELVYRVSAVTYGDSFPSSLVNDPVARGTARLYSLLLAPIFAVFEGDTALRVARGLNGVLWAAASIPVALLARRLTGSTWNGVAAGLLSIAVPWITVATLLFSESLAYLLFCWTVYAMAVTLAAPTPRRDLLVLVLMGALIATRVQFVALPIAWLVIVLVVGRGLGRRELFARHPFLLAGAALVAFGLLAVTVAGRLDQVLTSVGGPYSEIKDRGRPPSDAVVAAGYHGGMVVLGLGFVSAALLFPWLREAFSRRAGAEAYRFAVLAVAVVIALFLITISAQNGWSDGRAEERYYLYAVPFVWCGAIAAVRSGAVRAASIAWAGVALAAVLALVPLNISLDRSQAIYGPVGGSAGRILAGFGDDIADAFGWKAGPTPRDALVLVLLVALGLSVLLWSRLSPARRGLALAVPVALQLALTGYAFALVEGNVKGVEGLPLGSASDKQAWVDRALDGDQRASLAENRRGGDVNAYVHDVLWNDQVRERVRLPSALVREPPYPIGSLPGGAIAVTPDLKVTPGLPRHLVAMAHSPLWQPAGERLAATRTGDQELIVSAEPASLRWHADGLDGDGQVTKPVDVAVAPGYRATMLFGAPAHVGESQLAVELDGTRRTVNFPNIRFPVPLEYDLCNASGVTRGTITPTEPAEVGDGRRSGGVLVEVQLRRC